MSDLFKHSFILGRKKTVGDRVFLYEKQIESDDPTTEYLVVANENCLARVGDLVFCEPYSSTMGVFKYILI
jgi:hypothetical protein